MTRSLCLSVVTVAAICLAGCASNIIPMYEVDATHTIGRSLTEAQIQEAILGGAEIAGWRAKTLPSGRILATYHVRSHTVNVQIFYTDAWYQVTYHSSNGMKMFCTTSDRDKLKGVKVSGRDSCPGNGAPMYIHGNYKKWVDVLNNGIQNSLASI
jgi:hypothetical protein